MEKIQANSIYYEAALGKINDFSWKFGKRRHTKVSLKLELDREGLDFSGILESLEFIVNRYCRCFGPTVSQLSNCEFFTSNCSQQTKGFNIPWIQHPMN